MLKHVLNFLRDEEGASAVEYGLIIGLVAIGLVLVLIALAGPQGLGGLFTTVATCVSDPSAASCS